MWLCLAALCCYFLLFYSSIFSAAGTYTCHVASEGGTIDLAYLMLKSTHPMSHSAKQVNSFTGEESQYCCRYYYLRSSMKGYHRPRPRAGD